MFKQYIRKLIVECFIYIFLKDDCIKETKKRQRYDPEKHKGYSEWIKTIGKSNEIDKIKNEFYKDIISNTKKYINIEMDKSLEQFKEYTFKDLENTLLGHITEFKQEYERENFIDEIINRINRKQLNK